MASRLLRRVADKARQKLAAKTKTAAQKKLQAAKEAALKKARAAREAKAIAAAKAKNKAKSSSIANNNAKPKPSTVTRTQKSRLKPTGKRTTTTTKKTGVVTPSRSVQKKVAIKRADRRSTEASKRRKAAEKARTQGADAKTKTTSTKISPRLKRLESRKRLKTSRTSSLTKAQKERAALTKQRDIGAKAAAAKTPKSTRKTVSQAGGPVRKGADTPNSYDLTARQRDGKDPNYGKRSQPKSTNAPQTRSGRVERNARTDARQAADNFEVKARKTISDRVKRETEQKGLTGTQQRDLKRKLTRQMNAGKRRIKAAAEGRSTSSQTSAKTNTNPSVARQEGVSGRDWRNRMSDSKVQKLSKDLTKRLSGKEVRSKGELLQSPKGTGRVRQAASDPVTKTERARRSAGSRAKTGTGTLSVRGGGKKAESRAIKTSSNVKQDKPRTITNSRGEKEARISPRTQPNKRTTTARKDTAYEPRGIDPKRSNAAASKARQLKKDNPNRRLSSDTQPKKKTATRTTRSGQKSAMYSNKPSRPSNARATTPRDLKADAALRRRNEPARQASRQRAAERVLNRMQNRSKPKTQSYESFGQGTNRLGN